jgi:signal peptide peptidase-like 2B
MQPPLTPAFRHLSVCLDQVGLFCLAAVQAMAMVIATALLAAFPKHARHSVRVPLLGTCSTMVLVAVAASTTVALVWAMFRNSLWAWVLQDFMGVSVMLLVLRTMRIPSIKVQIWFWPIRDVRPVCALCSL